MRKLAVNNPQFERSFADLSHAYMRDRAPKLLDYMVGFQVLDKDEDETRAAGVFGFKVGKQWFLAPVFFLAGDVKGSELLYIKNQDTFVPMQENWVNYVLSRKPQELGKSVPQRDRQLGIFSPDFRVYTQSPLSGMGKSGSTQYSPESAEELHGYYHTGELFDVTPTIAWFCTSPNAEHYKQAEHPLTEIIRDGGPGVFHAFAGMLAKDAAFRAAVSKYYDGEELLAAIEKPAANNLRSPSDDELKSNNLSRQLFNYYVRDIAAKGVVAPESDMPKEVLSVLRTVGVSDPRQLRDHLPVVLEEPIEAAPVVTPKADKNVQVISAKQAAIPLDLTEDEARTLMTEGVVVRDFRKESSKAFTKDVVSCARNPDASGVYDVLLAGGDTAKAMVIMAPLPLGRGVTGDTATVVLLDDGAFVTAKRNSVFVIGEKLKDEPKLLDLRSVTSDEKYIVVDPQVRAGTLPFRVSSKADNTISLTDANTFVEYEHSLRTQRQKPVRTPELACDDMECAGKNHYGRVRKLTWNSGLRAPRAVGAMLAVPGNWRAFKLADYTVRTPTLGSEREAYHFVIKQADARPITIWSNGVYFQFKSAGVYSDKFGRVDALRTLIEGHGLCKESALVMLSDAREHGAADFFIKYAGGYSPETRMQPGPDAPSISQIDNLGTYDPQIQAIVETPENRTELVNNPDSQQDTREIYRPTVEDGRTMQAVSQAGNSGEKEVMDTALLGLMVKHVNTDSLVDKYLKDLVVGLDRVGRILFMYYWHYEKFKERYGDEEMQELEDALRNTFKSVGDLVLFLKKKAIESDTDMQGTDVDLDESMAT